MKYVRDSVNSSLAALYRTLEKPRFDVSDAIIDLESLVKVAKTTDDPRAHEFQCVLDEVEKRSKQLSAETMRDLMINLIGDPVRSKVLGKVTKMLKQLAPAQQNPPHRPFYRRRGLFRGRGFPRPYNSRPQRGCFHCNAPDHFVRDCPIKSTK